VTGYAASAVGGGVGLVLNARYQSSSVRHRRFERQPRDVDREDGVERCARLDARWDAGRERALDPDGLALGRVLLVGPLADDLGHPHRVPVDVEEFEPELVLRGALVPRDLDLPGDRERRPGRDVGPSSTEDVQLVADLLSGVGE